MSVKRDRAKRLYERLRSRNGGGGKQVDSTEGGEAQNIKKRAKDKEIEALQRLNREDDYMAFDFLDDQGD